MRLFIGLSLPDSISSHISTLRGSLPHLYWNDPDTYHIPLCCIGKIQHYSVIHDLDLALEKISCKNFELVIKGVNHFTSSSHENSFSVSIPATPALLHLTKKIAHVTRIFDLTPNKQRFVPHVTIATGMGINQEHISNWLFKYNLFQTEPFQIHQFSLFVAQPNHDKIYYDIESNYPLQ